MSEIIDVDQVYEQEEPLEIGTGRLKHDTAARNAH